MTLEERGRMVLTETRSCLMRPERWTQSAMARDAAGQDCSPVYNKATCWCLLGALTNAMYTLCAKHGGDPSEWSWARGRAKEHIRRVLGIIFIAKWQDEEGRTHAEVLSALDKALAIS